MSRTSLSGGAKLFALTVKLYGMASMRELITFTHEPSSRTLIGAFKETQDKIEDKIEELFFSPGGKSQIRLSGNHVLRIRRGASDADVSATAR